MAKTVPESKFTEWEGLDRIQRVVHQMKCIWRELNKDDFGIDGEIEVVTAKPDGTGYETHGSVIKVQSKSGASYVVGDSTESFATPVRKSDLELWHGSKFPTLLIVYHPADDKLYAKEVKEFVQSDPNAFKPPYRVTFTKATDEFSAGFFAKVAAYAGSSPPRISFREKERLFTNLLPVLSLPKIYESQSTVSEAEEVFKAIDGRIPPFSIRGDCFRTFDNLFANGSVLRQFTKGAITKVGGQEGLGDEARYNDVMFMLHQLLRSHLYHRAVSFNKHFRRFYFRRQNDRDLEFKQEWVSVRTGKKAPARTLVRYYEYGREKSITFWRHLAASIRFTSLGDHLYLQIVPKYLFTNDGHEPCDSDFVGPYTTRLKALEHNPQVLNHVLFWAWHMADGKPEISMKYKSRTLLRIGQEPLTTVAPFALPLDPAVLDEPVESMRQPLLFGEPDDEPGEDDDED